MAIEMLLNEAKDMSEEMIMEVVRFMKFIKTENSTTNGENKGTENNQMYRKAGIYKGKGWMSDDFDAPLDDFEEYM